MFFFSPEVRECLIYQVHAHQRPPVSKGSEAHSHHRHPQSELHSSCSVEGSSSSGVDVEDRVVFLSFFFWLETAAPCLELALLSMNVWSSVLRTDWKELPGGVASAFNACHGLVSERAFWMASAKLLECCTGTISGRIRRGSFGGQKGSKLSLKVN